MIRPAIGLLVIGQAPRPELLAEFRRVLGDAADLHMLGALDHLDAPGLAAAKPASDKDTLYTTLPDGTSILISKSVVTLGMERRLTDLKAIGAAVSIVCCTGKFPSLEAPGVHFASDVLAGAVEACLPKQGRVGIFIPTPAQASACEARWTTADRSCVTVPLTPGASIPEVKAAATEMARLAPDLVVHDCISYTKTSRDIAFEIHGRQTLQAASICAHFAAELCGL